MNRKMSRVVILCLALGMFAIGIGVFPGTQEVFGLNLVNDLSPRSNVYQNLPTVIQLARMPPELRAAELSKHEARLATGIVNTLRTQQRIGPEREVKHVKFFFGSLKNAIADDALGVKHRGHFEEELLARVVLDKDTNIDALVRCLNGVWFEFPADQSTLQALITVNVNEPFTISRVERPADHVNEPAVIDLTRQFKIPSGGMELAQLRS